MVELTKIRCVGCEGGIPALNENEIKQFLTKLNSWIVSNDQRSISKQFSFKNFYHTMAFVNAIAWMAHQENHHPDLEVGYNYCNIKYTTHAVNGLTQNDFICAAKVDAIIAEGE
jgi:4a-hydroxytetrahydrobiopterin dehydratase